MLYAEYGTTGMHVSRIGFGAMRFDSIDDEDACAAMVKLAYDKGINYFDTAPGYFEGKSEERLGLAFKDMTASRDERPFYVSTKSNKGEPGEIRKDLEESLGRMGLDHVDVFHMWWVVRPEWYRERKAQGALKEFSRLKEEGLARHIALSSHMKGDECAEVLADYDFEGVLMGYSAMNFRFRERALDAAASANRGVVAMNPLGGGIIPKHADRFEFLRTKEDETVVQAALRFLLNDDRVTVALVGFGNADHIEEAVAAVEAHEPIPQEVVEDIRSKLNQSLDRMCTGCGYCLPCPQGLQLPRLMQSYNELVFDEGPARLIDSMKWGYDVIDEPLDSCTECGACEEKCTQKLPITDRLKEMAREVEKSRSGG